MQENKDACSYYIWFNFRKWEDQLSPKKSLLSKEEIENQYKCFRLMIWLDTTAFDGEDCDAKIESVEIIYDGFSEIKSGRFRKNKYDVAKNKFQAEINPVVRLNLSRMVNEEDLMAALGLSSVYFSTSKMIEKSMDCFYLVDSSSYSRILNKEEFDAIASEFNANKVYNGKKFTPSSEEYEDCQIGINADKFVLI